MYIFWLTRDSLELGIGEIDALGSPKSKRLIDFVLLADSKKFNFERLAYTRSVSEFLFECSEVELEDKIAQFDWSTIFKKEFYIRLHNTKRSTVVIADLIWDKLQLPTNSKGTCVDFYFVDGKVIVGKFICDMSHDFEHRRPKYSFAHLPTLLMPKFAKALINLSGIQSGTLYDCFCGAGGVLVEGELFGFHVIGYDNDRGCLYRAKKNLKCHGFSNFELFEMDSTKIDHDLTYVVSDLPYGHSTKKVNLENLFVEFCKVLESHLLGKAVLVFPDYLDYKPLLAKTKLKLLATYSKKESRILTRNIIVLSRS